MKRKKQKAPQPKQSNWLKSFATHQTKFFWGLLAIFCLVLVFQPLTDVDIWWHITIGEGVLKHKSLPPVTDFYWSPVAYEIPPDLRYTWLGDLIFALTYRIAGAFGLQVLALVLVAFCLWMIWDMLGRKVSGWALLVLLFFLAGTYQMLIIRNALFGLPATVLIFWLWWRIQTRAQKKLWLAFPILLGLWSCMHGTYLFGFGVLILLVAGEQVDHFLSSKPFHIKPVLKRAVILGLSYAAISLFNPFTISVTKSFLSQLTAFPLWILVVAGLAVVAGLFAIFKFPQIKEHSLAAPILNTGLGLGMLGIVLRHFWPFLTDKTYLKTMNLRAYQSQVDIETLGLLGRLKHGFNNTFWKSDLQQMASLDFFSPFDFPGEVYVWTSLILLGILSLIVFRKHNRHFVHLLPLFAIVFLGLGYLRTIGFITIFSIYLIATTKIFETHALTKKLSWPLCFFLTFLALLSGFSSLNPLGLNADHQVRPGVASYFPSRLAERAEEAFPEKNIFTTIENGGYLLNAWYPDKKVFMDGFFRPHEGQTFLDYIKAMDTQDPEILYERYGITLAIVGIRDSNWFATFNTARSWVPRMADRGAILFERIAIPPPDYEFELLMNEANWHLLEPYLKKLYALRLYDVAFKLLSEGLFLQAMNVFSNDDPVAMDISRYATAEVKGPFEKSLEHLLAQYGRSNNPLIRVEFELSEAVQNQDQNAILRLGETLVASQPQRVEIWKMLIDTATRMGQSELAASYQERAQAAAPQDPEP